MQKGASFNMEGASTNRGSDDRTNRQIRLTNRAVRSSDDGAAYCRRMIYFIHCKSVRAAVGALICSALFLMQNAYPKSLVKRSRPHSSLAQLPRLSP